MHSDMRAPSIPLIRLRGRPGDCGLQHAQHLMPHFRSEFFDAYLADMSAANRVPREVIRMQSAVWLEHLPPWAQEEIDGMGRGLKLTARRIAEFLYADIATTTGGPNSILIPGGDPGDSEIEGEILAGGGPGCTAVVASAGGEPWVARNCDWLWATLRRGCAAVVHEVPGRHRVLALGIHGDIDLDTGINEHRLWVHLHTLPSPDKVRTRTGLARFSWLFWAREALERCATLDELEVFIAATERDRGVILIAADGKTGQSALFECGRTGYERLGPIQEQGHLSGAIIATNHCRARHPPDDHFATGQNGEPMRTSRRGSTVRRCQRVREILRCGAIDEAPHDLIEILADADVEMRDPTHLRTIYSAVCAPASGAVFFAQGDFAERAPAASSSTWQQIEWPWL